MTQAALLEKDYFTIAELTYRLNTTLEKQFPRVKFEGEISDMTLAKSGHLYFKLKDTTSQIEAVMWRTSMNALKFKPERGMLVLCDGKPNVYGATGRLQMVVTQMTRSGDGALQQKFLELKAKLEKEGLFATARKRDIPYFPKAVGVVTSGSGAVIHDIMVKIKERMPSTKVFLVDVKVQGEGAAHEIAEGIRLLNEFGKVEVIIVGRGGGSLEDLWAFNEEEVVRAVFASTIPIISSVGHEVDYSLSDFAADVRAPTPTAAAEMVVPHRQELRARVSELGQRILDYSRWFSPIEQRIDDLELRLTHNSGNLLQRMRLGFNKAENQLKVLEPTRIIEVNRQKLRGVYERLVAATRRSQELRLSQIEILNSKLESLNPYKVLKRGYSLVQKKGKVITNTDEIQNEDLIQIRFASGQASALVKSKST